jgi:hypothetical protein
MSFVTISGKFVSSLSVGTAILARFFCLSSIVASAPPPRLRGACVNKLYQGISFFGRHGADGSAHKRARPGRCATARSDIPERRTWSVLPLIVRMKRRGPERRRLQVQRRRWEKPKPARAQHIRIQQVHRRHRRQHHLSTRCSRRSKRFFRREHHLHLYMGSSSLDA